MVCLQKTCLHVCVEEAGKGAGVREERAGEKSGEAEGDRNHQTGENESWG